MNKIMVVVEKMGDHFLNGSDFLIKEARNIAEMSEAQLFVEVITNAESIYVMGYSNSLEKRIKQENISLCILPATQFGNELASMTIMGETQGIICDAAKINWNKEKKRFEISRLSTDGKTMDTYCCKKGVYQIATLKLQNQLNSSQENIELFYEHELVPTSIEKQPEIQCTLTESINETEIENAEYVFAGGRGIGGKEGFQKLEEFALTLGAQTATSRANVDEGWMGKEKQVGLSGKIIAPKVYFTVGVSGAAHHVIGVEQAGTIIAVDWDRNAAIFDVADLGIVADGQKLLALMLEKVKN